MVVVEDDLTSCMDGGVEDRRGVNVYTIKVDATLISSVMASHHTIRIQQRDELEHKHVTQPFSPWVPGHDEVEEAIKNKARGGLPRVYSSRDEHHLLAREAVGSELTGHREETGQSFLSLLSPSTV